MNMNMSITMSMKDINEIKRLHNILTNIEQRARSAKSQQMIWSEFKQTQHIPSAKSNRNQMIWSKNKRKIKHRDPIEIVY